VSAKSDLVIVSNRLPVRRVTTKGRPSWERSPGGLVSAMEPILRSRSSTWIGWEGVAGTAPRPFRYEQTNIHPVRLRAKELRSFYDGFCNRTLWPLYHDSVRSPEYRRRWWWPYVEVNRRFADVVEAVAEDGAIVWVHDYQLQLVPGMLRQSRPDLRIGFFLHIPFPPQELFARLPWREQILDGMLGADVVGFQTRMGARNFSELARRYATARGTVSELTTANGRQVRVSAFPISIDAALYERTAAMPEVIDKAQQFRERLGGRRILLGVDRMDYTKGIEVRMKAFRELLQQDRVRADDCVFVQLAVPSRERVEEYQTLREHVEQMVGEINGTFGRLGHAPVQYLHRSLPLEDLVALYVAADVMIVTPHRDGMNLVAKEYVMCRPDGDGVLILSEFTGAANELTSALLVNPHDVDGLVSTIEASFQMPRSEQRRRIRAMQRDVRKHDVYHWARTFFEALEESRIPEAAARS
jgi:trehalose 6-phosphate synthase